jgi:uncharacterized protein YdeI (YjbR/CyaY-like superfamily)
LSAAARAGSASRAPRFFATAAAFRAWLVRNHARAAELLVGFHRVGSGTRSMTYPQALEEALCFGWIDGVRRSLDAARYTIRFTPRRPGSHWSLVNVRHAARLEAEGRMAAPGRAAFAARDPERTGRASYESPPRVLPPAYARRLAADAEAHAHFSAMPPWYRRVVTHWVTSAKREETRERRFATLLEHSRRGRRVPPLDPTNPRAASRRPKPARKA